MMKGEHDIGCVIPGCDEALYVYWEYAYRLYPADLEGEAPPQLVDHHTSSWRLECEGGHVVLLPGDTGCCEEMGEGCGHVLTEYDWDQDNRTFTRNDMRRLRRLCQPAGQTDELRRINATLVRAVQRLAVTDEMAGIGDVIDPEGLARIALARRALSDAGLSHKRGAP